MSARTAVVERYFDGFRHTDHDEILACLTDDVAWELPGYRSLRGKAAFDGEIEGEGFTGRPTLVVERLIEGLCTVVAIGNGEAHRVGGTRHRFAFCDVFTFRDDLVSRVESYLVPLPEA
jgi:ketosteroid isomerase-like protein